MSRAGVVLEYMTLRFFLKNPRIRYPLASAFFLTVVQILLIVFYIKPSTEPIFLHYTTYLGVDFVGAWYFVYLIPLSTFLLSLVNALLAYFFARRDIIFAQIITATSAVAAVFLLIYTVLIVRLNS